MAPPASLQILLPLLVIALTGGAAFVIIGLLERRREPRLPSFAPFVLVAIPALLILVASLAVRAGALSAAVQPYLMLLYVILPLLMIRYGYRLDWYRSALYSVLILALAGGAGVLMMNLLRMFS